MEQSILSDCILFGDEIDTAASIIDPADFYSTAHQLIYKAIQQLYFTGQPVTLVEVWKAVGNELKRYGGAYYLAKLTDEPVPTSLEYYCKKIKSLAKKRRAIAALAHKYYELTGSNIPEVQTETPKHGRTKQKRIAISTV